MTTSNAGQGASDLSPLKRAYLALEQLQAKVRALEQARSEPIAVIGMACRLPGGADSADAYWRLLQAGTDAVCEVPADRWNIDAYYDPDPAAAGKMCTRSGGYLREPIDLFDPQFFGVSPREAVTMDPQHRLLLEVGWEALENAAGIEDRLAGSSTGVFVGITSHDYSDLHFTGHDLGGVGAHLITGNAHNAAAGRLSYCFGFHGPCMAIDTACSSSLVSIHLACKSLLQDECRRALAGGVNLILSPLATIALSQGRVLAPDGRCRAFDAAASGMVRGEGCAMVVLKRLSHAVEDGDNILAVIAGTAVNQDGPSSGLTVPNGPAQEALIRQALAGADLQPGDIDYIEAHGTGTPLGDPIELRALAGVFGANRNRPLVLGSVKTNIGHLEACAGIAGVMKVVLSLQHGEIPQRLHFRNPTPHLAWNELPFVVPTEPRPWPRGSRPRRAGVSSFGFSGVNAHVVLQEAPKADPPGDSATRAERKAERPLHLLPLSGRSKASLRQTAERVAQHLDRHRDLALEDACFSAGVGRSHANHRLAVIAGSCGEARDNLLAFVEGRSAAGIEHGSSSTPPKVAFLFTGQGSQYVGMGRELYETQPVFRKTLQRCDEILRPWLRRPLLEVLYQTSTEASPLDDTAYTQPALFALEYALAELWQSWGVRPAIVLGHSVGEYVAACVAGVFSLEDGLKLVAEGARLMQGLRPDGSMLAIFAPASEVERIIRPCASEVCIAAYNAPNNVMISGGQLAVATVADQCEAAGISVQRLAVSHAFHSHHVDPILDAFEGKVRELSLAAPRIGLISNLDGALVSNEVTKAEYWRRHLREPVRFAQGIAAAREKGCTVFLEIGPKPTLLGLAQQCVEGQDMHWLPSLRPGCPDWKQMLQSLAGLYVHGTRIDWPGFERPYPRRRVALPATPFQRQRYWLESGGRAENASAVRQDGRVHPLLGRRLSIAGTKDICFQSDINPDNPVFLQDHVVLEQAILPASAYLEMAVAAACATFGCEGAVLENIAFHQALRFADREAKTLQTVLKPEGVDTYSFEIYSRVNDHAGDSWVCHASGLCRPAASAIRAPEDFVLPLADAGEVVDMDALYRRARACGIDLGPRFQALRRAWRRDTQALGELTLPDSLVFGADAYHMHPVMMDGAFQAMGAVFADQDNSELYLPIAVDRVVFQARTGTAGWSRVRVQSIGEGAEQGLRADLQLLSADGHLVALLEGFHLKLTSRERVLAAGAPAFADWLYETDWLPGELQPQQSSAHGLPEAGKTRIDERGRELWLVLAPASSALADALRREIEQSGDLATLVYPGKTYEWRPDGTAWIDPTDPTQVRRLLDDVAAKKKGRLAKIVHLWGTCPEAAADFEAGSPDKAGMLGWGAALHLVQAVMDTSDRRPPEMWLVTQRAQGINERDDLSGIAQAPLIGFAKVVNLECPDLRCVCVDIDSGQDERAALRLFEEIRSNSAEDQVAFRGEQRYVTRLARHSGAGKPSRLPIGPDATYLITGGQRGLGLQTAKWLVARGARSLVLLSRSDNSAEISRDLAEMRRAGADVSPVVCDVSNASQVTQVLAEIELHRSPLRGIVHAAGVLDDATLAQQSVERFHRVLAPKMLGAWHLHRMTRHQPLDFFVLYSSMASLLGAAGQANYAAANAFLDGLARHRRSLGLPGLSINWTGWSEIGMAARHQMGQRIVTQGLGTIAPKQGMEILEYLLSRSSAQVGVAPIDWSILGQRSGAGRSSPFFSNFRDRQPAQPARDQRLPKLNAAFDTATSEERLAVVAAHLCAEIAAVLRLGPEDVDMQQPLNRIGLDSLMAVELRNRLRFQLGLDVPMVSFMQGTSIAQLAADLSVRLAANPSTHHRNDDEANLAKIETGESHPLEALGAEPLLDQLDQLSDEEVDALLGAALSGKLPER